MRGRRRGGGEGDRGIGMRVMKRFIDKDVGERGWEGGQSVLGPLAFRLPGLSQREAVESMGHFCSASFWSSPPQSAFKALIISLTPDSDLFNISLWLFFPPCTFSASLMLQDIERQTAFLT